MADTHSNVLLQQAVSSLSQHSFAEAEAQLSQAWTQLRPFFPLNPLAVEAGLRLGELLRERDSAWEQARDILELVWDAAKRTDPVGETVTRAGNSLGRVWMDAEDYEKAVSVLLYSSVLHPDSEWTAVNHCLLSICYSKTGDMKKAKSWLKSALGIAAKALQHSSALALICKTMGELAALTEMHKDAIRLLSMAKDTYTALREVSKDSGETLAGLGTVYEQLGKVQEAEANFTASLALLRSLNPDSASSLSIWTTLGQFYGRQHQEDKQEAEVTQRYAYLRGKSSESRYTQDTRRELVALYEQKGMEEEAEKVLVEASRSSNTAEAMGDLGMFYARKGKAEEAEDLLKKAYERQKAVAPSSADTDSYLRNLRWLYEQQGRFGDMETTIKDMLALHKSLDPYSDDSLMCYYDLACFYMGQERAEEAENTFAEAATGLQAARPDAIATASAFLHLSWFLASQERFEESKTAQLAVESILARNYDGEKETARALVQHFVSTKQLEVLEEVEEWVASDEGWEGELTAS